MPDTVVAVTLTAFAEGFAVFGLAWLFRYTNGPFHMFRRFRRVVGIRYMELHDSDGNVIDEVEEISKGHLPELFSCFWCLSTWVSLILTTIVYLSYRSVPTPMLVIMWLNGVGFSGFLHEWIESNYGKSR